jgi:hypothetical protein
MEFGLTVGQLTERLTTLFRRFRTAPDLPSPSPGAHVADRVE